MSHIIFWNTNVAHELVNVPNRYLGPYRLSQWLNMHGYDSKVIDFASYITTQELVSITEKLITSETVAIGVSTTFWFNWQRTVIDLKIGDSKLSTRGEFIEPQWVIDAREILQAKYPNIQWLLGGSGVTDWVFYGRRKEKFEWIKFYSHSEDSILKYMDEKTKKKFFAPIRDSFNICTAVGVFNTEHGIQPHEVLPIDFARGCQFKCKFCRYPLLGKEKNTYIRNPQSIEQELLSNYEKFGTTRYMLVDDTVNETDEKIISLAEIANRLPFKLEWVGYLRLDLIGTRKHTIPLLKESGLRSAFFGIESFNPESSKLIGKGWIGKHGKDALLQLHEEWKREINFHLGFIVGIGNETIEELEETDRWCRENVFGSWRYSPLSIIANNNSLEHPSIFDVHHKEHGYYFPDERRLNDWRNGYWTFDKALEVAIMLNNKDDSGHYYAGFPLALTASAGYSFDELMQTPIFKTDEQVKSEKIKTLLRNYVQHMLK